MERDSCDHCITEKEFLNSLKQLHNCKTPGTYRQPPDFYKCFWIDIKLLLIERTEHATKTGKLSIVQKEVSLLCFIRTTNQDFFSQFGDLFPYLILITK